MTATPDGYGVVTAAEVDQWVAAVERSYPEAADPAGGVAARTIIKAADSDRAVATVLEHLRARDEVREVWGVDDREGRGGGVRKGFVPVEAER